MGANSFEKSGHARPVGQIELVELVSGAPFQLGQAGVLEPDIVVIIDVIQANDLEPAIEEAFGEVETDKPGDTGNKNFHSLESNSGP